MTKLLKSDYTLVKFVKGPANKKKYTAILRHKRTGKTRKIHFGGMKKDGTPYEQYKDNVLGLYAKYNHGDKKRRGRYQERHKKEKPSFNQYYSAGYFSYKFLW